MTTVGRYSYSYSYDVLMRPQKTIALRYKVRHNTCSKERLRNTAQHACTHSNAATTAYWLIDPQAFALDASFPATWQRLVEQDLLLCSYDTMLVYE